MGSRSGNSRLCMGTGPSFKIMDGSSPDLGSTFPVSLGMNFWSFEDLYITVPIADFKNLVHFCYADSILSRYFHIYSSGVFL